MEAANAKSPAKSLTIWGAVSVLVATTLQASGVEITSPEIDQALELIVAAVGAVAAIIGRIRANKTLKV